MNAILSLITGPIGNFLASIAGPLFAFLGGWKVAKDGARIDQLEATAAIVKAEAQAQADAPKTVSEAVARLRDTSREI